MTVERIEVDETSLRRVVEALRAESDASDLNRDFVEEMRKAVEPAAEAARSAILSMGVSGLHHADPGLRTSIAEHTKVEVRLGNHPSVAIRVSKTGMPRNFSNAPKRTNARKGWRHPVFGQDVWVSQRGKPGWFDDTIPKFKPAAERRAEKVLDNVAERISLKTKG